MGSVSGFGEPVQVLLNIFAILFFPGSRQECRLEFWARAEEAGWVQANIGFVSKKPLGGLIC